MGSDNGASGEVGDRSRGSERRMRREVGRGSAGGTVADGDAQDVRRDDSNAYRDGGLGNDGFGVGIHDDILV